MVSADMILTYGCNTKLAFGIMVESWGQGVHQFGGGGGASPALPLDYLIPARNKSIHFKWTKRNSRAIVFLLKDDSNSDFIGHFHEKLHGQLVTFVTPKTS